MIKKYFILRLLLGLFFLPLFVSAQDLQSKLAEIEAYAEKTRAEWNIPGMTIGIVKDDKVVFAKGFGVRELGKPEKVDGNTLFAIGSCTKAYTTAAIAMLVDEGKLKWDDKVTQYVPEFQMYDPYVTREMMIRDIVSHRSGLETFSGDLLWYETTYGPDELIRRIRYLKPTSSFRSKFGYQNLMYIVAGKVIERVSGKKWQDFIQSRILDPLGMKTTKTSDKQIGRGDNAAHPHNEHTGTLAPIGYTSLDSGAPAGAIISNASESANWLRLQLGNGKFEGKQLISEAQIWEMRQPHIMNPVSPASSRLIPSRHFNGYGLGWGLSDYQGRKVVSHGGGLPGMIAQTAMIPEENLGVVIYTNSETGVASLMANKIFDVFLGAPNRDWSKEAIERTKQAKEAVTAAAKKAEESRIPNTKPSLPLSGYVGTYSSQMYGDVTITEENGHLVMRMLPAPVFVADLTHWHYDTFAIKWGPGVIYPFQKGFVIFTLDGKGKTDQLKIDQPNNDFHFTELELRRK